MDAPRRNAKKRGENQHPPVSIYISIGELTSNWKQQPTWYLQLVSVEQMLTTRTFIFMSLKKTSPINSRRCFSTNLHVQQTLGDTTTVTSIRVGARRTPLVSSEEVKTSHDNKLLAWKKKQRKRGTQIQYQSQNGKANTLLGTKIPQTILKTIFLFPRWDVLVHCRVSQNCLVRKKLQLCNFDFSNLSHAH